MQNADDRARGQMVFGFAAPSRLSRGSIAAEPRSNAARPPASATPHAGDGRVQLPRLATPPSLSATKPGLRWVVRLARVRPDGVVVVLDCSHHRGRTAAVRRARWVMDVTESGAAPGEDGRALWRLWTSRRRGEPVLQVWHLAGADGRHATLQFQWRLAEDGAWSMDRVALHRER